VPHRLPPAFAPARIRSRDEGPTGQLGRERVKLRPII
jgi:hypothetical protein